MSVVELAVLVPRALALVPAAAVLRVAATRCCCCRRWQTGGCVMIKKRDD